MGKLPSSGTLLAAAALLATLLASCSNGTVATRHVPRPRGEPATSTKFAIASTGHLYNNLKSSSYIESGDHRKKFSCSFVEFGERGDYLDFQQHQHCWLTIRKLAREQRILLVLYCHGWKHNSQSSDVLSFNKFLGTLARTRAVRDAKLRVHGVYLSWRGDAWRPEVKKSFTEDIQNEYFGGESIVDRGAYAAKLPLLTKIPKNLTYWNRRKAAENRVSGVPLSRSVFTFASVARYTKPANKNVVVLMGHSFGALMLEQSVAEASTGVLVTQMPWHRGKPKARVTDLLPFDMMLFVNSAAPSLYAKMLRDLSDAHNSAQESKQPLIVSLTSKADTATGIVHPLGNSYSVLQPGMWKDYEQQIFEKAAADPVVNQGYFFRRTPGHNKFLLSHEIIKDRKGDLADPDPDPDQVFEQNLTAKSGGRFLTRASAEAPVQKWTFAKITRVEHGHPHTTFQPLESPYWVIRCEKDLISGHNDIWNNKAMQTYAALFGIARALR